MAINLFNRLKKNTISSEIELYKTIREIGMKLNSNMLTDMDKNLMLESARLLGILENNTFVFEDEQESTYLQDFSIFEKFKLNTRKSLVEIYRKNVGSNDDIEDKLFDASEKSYTSLFKVKSTHKNEFQVHLNDILRKEDITILDIGFSQTVQTGTLIFTRIIPFEQFNISSGASFTFSHEKEEYLLRRQRTLKKKYELEGVDIARYIAFFMLNRTDGIASARLDVNTSEILM